MFILWISISNKPALNTLVLLCFTSAPKHGNIFFIDQMSSQPRPFLTGKKREWDEMRKKVGLLRKRDLGKEFFLFLHASRTLTWTWLLWFRDSMFPCRAAFAFRSRSILLICLFTQGIVGVLCSYGCAKMSDRKVATCGETVSDHSNIPQRKL